MAWCAWLLLADAAQSAGSCQLGEYYDARSAQCARCPPGHRCDGAGSAAACGGDMHFSVGGAAHCRMCPPGSFTSGGSVEARQACTACPPGHKCDGSSQRTPCPGNTFSDQQGAASCKPCSLLANAAKTSCCSREGDVCITGLALGFSLRTGERVSLALSQPRNGTRVIAPTVRVAMEMVLPPGAQPGAHMVCIALDGGGSACSALAEAARYPISLAVEQLGWHRLRAWVRRVDSEDALAGAETLFFAFNSQAAGAGGGGAGEARGGGGGGGGGVPDEVSRVRAVTGACGAGAGAGGGCAGHERGGAERERYFDTIYDKGVWAQGGLGARSGAGSTEAFAANAAAALQAALRELMPRGVRRIVDVPCGDMTWMPNALAPFLGGGIEYTGYDISGLIVRENQRRFAAQPQFRFAQFDAVETPLPHGRFDLIFCRHLMFHLTPAHGARLLRRFTSSGAKYLMATTYLRADENEEDFVLAFGHKTNLFRRPYCIRDPVRMYLDGETDMMLGLWQLTDDDGEALPPLLNWTDLCRN